MRETNESRQQYLECEKSDAVAASIEELHRTKSKKEGNK